MTDRCIHDVDTTPAADMMIEASNGPLLKPGYLFSVKRYQVFVRYCHPRRFWIFRDGAVIGKGVAALTSAGRRQQEAIQTAI
tara:strand:+ start:388 stop:633 length:246 start_codon:yes stop_codon:yes gene_type:complete